MENISNLDFLSESAQCWGEDTSFVFCGFRSTHILGEKKAFNRFPEHSAESGPCYNTDRYLQQVQGLINPHSMELK